MKLRKILRQHVVRPKAKGKNSVKYSAGGNQPLLIVVFLSFLWSAGPEGHCASVPCTRRRSLWPIEFFPSKKILEPHGLTHRAGGKRPLFPAASCRWIEEKKKCLLFFSVFLLLLYSSIQCANAKRKSFFYSIRGR